MWHFKETCYRKRTGLFIIPLAVDRQITDLVSSGNTMKYHNDFQFSWSVGWLPVSLLVVDKSQWCPFNEASAGCLLTTAHFIFMPCMYIMSIKHSCNLSVFFWKKKCAYKGICMDCPLNNKTCCSSNLLQGETWHYCSLHTHWLSKWGWCFP